MVPRLPMAPPQVKSVNTSKSLLNEMCRVINSLYQIKEINKNAHNNIINSIKI